tara:strand:+ start:4368 stop:4913 length:546 start_codon:yes stop_codon:yes gene_type:complete
MPFKDPVKRKEYAAKRFQDKQKQKEYDRLRYETNKNDPEWKSMEKERRKKDYEKNKEKYLEQKKEYYLKNREAKLKYQNQPKAQSTTRRCRWKRMGIRDEDNDKYVILHTRWLNATNCELCNKELLYSKRPTANSKCLEHDHVSGYVRSVCCMGCNTFMTARDSRFHVVLLELHRYFKINL